MQEGQGQQGPRESRFWGVLDPLEGGFSPVLTATPSGTLRSWAKTPARSVVFCSTLNERQRPAGPGRVSALRVVLRFLALQEFCAEDPV